MDNDKRKVLSFEEKTKLNNNPQRKGETTKGKSVVANDDGTRGHVNQSKEKKQLAGIIGEPQKIEEYDLGVSMEDTKYADAIRTKEELAVMYNEKLLLYIRVSSFEKILKLINESLNTYFDSIAYGIYSSEEIIELRNSLRSQPPKKEEEYTKNFDVCSPNEDKLKKRKMLNDDLFDNVQNEIDRIKEQEEKKKKKKRKD